MRRFPRMCAPTHSAAASTGRATGISPAPVSHHWHVTIAPSTVVLAGVVFWTLFLVGFFVARFIDVLLTIFVAILFSTFLTPIVNKLEQLPYQAQISSDVIISREGKVLKHRNVRPIDPRKVKRALRLLGVKSQ